MGAELVQGWEGLQRPRSWADREILDTASLAVCIWDVWLLLPRWEQRVWVIGRGAGGSSFPAITYGVGNCSWVPRLAREQPEILHNGNRILLFPDLTQSRCKGLAEIRKCFVCEVEANGDSACCQPEEPMQRENQVPLGQERPGSAGEGALCLL